MVLRYRENEKTCPLGYFSVRQNDEQSLSKAFESCISCHFGDFFDNEEIFDPENVCKCPDNMTYCLYERLVAEYSQTHIGQSRDGFIKYVKEKYQD